MSLLQDQPALLALAIFVTRVADVSLGTLRTIMVFRGYRALAVATAFVEVLLWIVAVSSVLHNLDRWYLAFAYAAGFATGNYLGMWIEAKLALGNELLRAISRRPDVRLADRLRAAQYAVTEIPGRGRDGPVEVLFIVERRRRIPGLLRLVRELDPEAWCTLSDVRHPPGLPAPRALGWRGLVRK